MDYKARGGKQIKAAGWPADWPEARGQDYL
jgi:hypothetical protein